MTTLKSPSPMTSSRSEDATDAGRGTGVGWLIWGEHRTVRFSGGRLLTTEEPDPVRIEDAATPNEKPAANVITFRTLRFIKVGSRGISLAAHTWVGQGDNPHS